ncbi:MAG: ABC transporter permease [Deltaproteobacteria bacterium]|nr:ABC transporter permease [Deltaproteobacteria bacterium]
MPRPQGGPYSTRGEISLVPAVAEGAEDLLHRIGRETRESLAYVGGLARLSGSFSRVFAVRPIGMRAVIDQCESIGLRSLPIALLIMFFVGLVFALQFGLTLQTMGAVPYVGRVTSLSIVRELGPVFTALVVGGRVGAGMAAELGSMRVTEQVDAIRALGADPVKKLVVPRVLATTLMLPLVTLFADILGIIGGMIISWAQFDLSMVRFFDSAVDVVRATDFISGYTKPFFFGFGIAVIGCYEGLTCGQGTEGVGRATTRTVVNVSVMVVLVDFFLTKIFTMLPRI